MPWPARWTAPAVAALALLAAAPPASACHASTAAEEGVVLRDGGPVRAEIQFPLAACSGPVSVTVTLLASGGPTRETLEARLNVTGVPAGECLPWDTCAPSYPPAARFTLESPGGALDLEGAAANGLHVTEVTYLAGTYRGDPATFAAVKPV